MRFLSIHLPFLATDRLHRRQRHEKDRAQPPEPLAVWAKVENAEVLTAVDALARARKLHAGMPVAVARSMCPKLHLVEADPDAEAALLVATVDWCRRFTPLAALDLPDGAILDVSGVAHLFGGEAGLVRTIETALAAQGFAARLALAPHAAAASAFARFEGPKFVRDQATLEKAVRALPVTALRLDAARVSKLRDAGLRSLGDLLLRPRAPITARFGKTLFSGIDAMLGLRRDPLSPRFEAPPYIAECRFPEGLTRQDAISAALRQLCEELCAMLARHEEGARQIFASFFRVDGVVRHLEAATSRPSRDPRALLRLLDARLAAIGEEGLDTGYGFDVIRLAALAVERLPAAQSSLRKVAPSANAALPLDGGASAPIVLESKSDADFTDLVDQLGARFGTHRVLRLDFIDTHWPDGAVVLRPAAQGPAKAPAAVAALPAQATPLLTTRPAKLFERPEPIMAMATVPDGPPEQFRWRRVLHKVVAAEGPERIASEWWRDVGPTRDYFRVEDAEGGRFWLFREGLYGAETMTPRWFLHGVFA